MTADPEGWVGVGDGDSIVECGAVRHQRGGGEDTCYMEFADGAQAIKTRAPEPARQNTTLVVVATNVALTKVEATKLAQFGSVGVARTKPVARNTTTPMRVPTSTRM